MESLIQKLIPGIIALLCGFVFIFGRQGIEQKIISSHEKFWKQTLKLQSEVGKFGGLFFGLLNISVIQFSFNSLPSRSQQEHPMSFRIPLKFSEFLQFPFPSISIIFEANDR